MNFFFENLSLVPETRVPKEHFKLVFGSGTSDLAKIRPLKNWHSPDFLSGFALWNFASETKQNKNWKIKSAVRRNSLQRENHDSVWLIGRPAH